MKLVFLLFVLREEDLILISKKPEMVKEEVILSGFIFMI